MNRLVDASVAVLVLAMAFWANTFAIAYDVVVLLGATYLMLRLSPTLLFTGTRSLLDDIMVCIGFILLQQRFVPETYGGIATLVGGLVLVMFPLVLVLTGSIKKGSMLGRFQKRTKLRRFFWAFVFIWSLYAVVYRPIVIWVTIQPFLLLAFCSLVFLRKRPTRFLKLFNTKRGFLLGLAGLLVVHEFMYTLLALTQSSAHSSVQWLLAIIGFCCLAGLPPYMWYKTFRVRSDHIHLPDWKAWQTALFSGLLIFPFFWPVVWPAEGTTGIVLTPLLPTMSWLPVGVAATVAVVWFVVATTDAYLRRVLMIGPFLGGAAYLGIYAYYAFVTEFSGIVALEPVLWSLPVHILVFVILAFFHVFGYFSFLYELWRE